METRKQCLACILHGVPTLCDWEVARSLTLSSPFWIAVNTARSSCATISEILVFREPRVWMSCCACVVRMSRGFSVSWSISHCRKGFLKVYVTPIQLLCVYVCVCIAATHVGNTHIIPQWRRLCHDEHGNIRRITYCYECESVPWVSLGKLGSSCCDRQPSHCWGILSLSWSCPQWALEGSSHHLM